MLELLKTTHVLSTMFILEYSLADLNSERNLEEQWKNEKKSLMNHHVEPPCGTPEKEE